MRYFPRSDLDPFAAERDEQRHEHRAGRDMRHLLPHAALVNRDQFPLIRFRQVAHDEAPPVQDANHECACPALVAAVQNGSHGERGSA
jgi:hypothetical protein